MVKARYQHSNEEPVVEATSPRMASRAQNPDWMQNDQVSYFGKANKVSFQFIFKSEIDKSLEAMNLSLTQVDRVIERKSKEKRGKDNLIDREIKSKEEEIKKIEKELLSLEKRKKVWGAAL